MSNLEEVNARRGKIILFTDKRGKEFYLSSYDKVVAPIPIKKSFKKLYIGEVVEAEILDNGHPFETGQLSVNVTYSIGNKNHQDIKIKLAKHKYNFIKKA